MSDEQPGDPPAENMESRLTDLQEQIEEYRRRSGELRLALETLTTVDPVTGVRNRYGIVQSIEGALQWNAREGTPFGVMAVSVPELGEIVDGEPVALAEEAMAHVAAVLSAGLRAVDRVGRWSDTIFLVVLAKLEETGTTRISTRLSSMLSAVPFQAGEREYQLAPRMSCALVADGADVQAEGITRRLVGAPGSEDPSRPELIRFPATP